MSSYEKEIKEIISKLLDELYSAKIPADEIALQETRKEFSGDITLVTFPFTKINLLILCFQCASVCTMACLAMLLTLLLKTSIPHFLGITIYLHCFSYRWFYSITMYCCIDIDNWINLIYVSSNNLIILYSIIISNLLTKRLEK